MRIVDFVAILGAPATVLASLLLTPPAVPAAESSTGSLTVTAQNAGAPNEPSSLRLTLTAHSASSSADDASCRPQNLTLRCWGSLVLRIPAFGSMTLTGLDVHRITLGNTSCGGDDGGGTCGSTGMIASAESGGPVEVQVNGLSTIVDPGSSGLPPGTRVQVKIAMTDAGLAPYQDTVAVQVNEFVDGPIKPLVYETGEQFVQQVQVHVQGR